MNIFNLWNKLFSIKGIEFNELRSEVSTVVTDEDKTWRPCNCLGYVAMHRINEYICAYDEYNRPVEIVGTWKEHKLPSGELLSDKQRFEYV